ncbi:uncharacterized protein LOC131626562 [Vicia villosa]|uniref:uncharacterized protein LOC131626562 n=1 Tax=Vicia villosa TaxID=3911 RepID=UPI00273BAD54|nr:uncharacterized protein LOC131626562 [Vicia villosa]
MDFKYHPRCAKLNITNICFADDLMLFARGDVLSVQTMMAVFHSFSEETSLKANPDKCKVFFGGTGYEEQQAIKESTGCIEGKLPIRYLGVPLTSRKLSVIQCQPLIDKMIARIQHWSVKFLSYAGRQQLVQSVLISITNYWMSVFPLPKKVIQKIEALCRNFLWSAKTDGRKALVSWENTCEPRNAGGLNFKKLIFWKKATIMKLLWNIHNKNDKLWIRWLDIYFLKGNSILSWQVQHTSSWMLNSILKCRTYTQNNVAWEKAEASKVFNTAAIYNSLCGESWVQRIDWRNLGSFMKNIAVSACSFIWHRMLDWNGYTRYGSDWDTEKRWLIEELAKKGWRREILRINLAETVYHIWQARNEIIFKNNSPNLDVTRKITESVIGRIMLAKKLKIHINASRDSII